MTSPNDTTPRPPIEETVEQTIAARESLSLKRAREGSVAAATAPPIATKKNRVEGEPTAPDTNGTNGSDEEVLSQTAAQTAPNGTAAPGSEGKTVGEVRRKVEELNWKEGEGPKPAAAEASAEDSTPAAAADGDVEVTDVAKEGEEESAAKEDNDGGNDVDQNDWVEVDKAEATEAAAAENDGNSLKRKAVEGQDESTSADEKKRKSTSPPADSATPKSPKPPKSPRPTTADATAASPSADATAAPAEAPRKQATFGSFSAKASPFAAAASSSSPFAAKASSTSAFGNTSSSSPFGNTSSASPFGNTSAASPFGAAKPKNALDDEAAKPAAASGFGNYSSAFSPFAKKAPAASETENETAKAGPSSFGDILQEKGDEKEAAAEDKVTWEEQHVPTGEEEEETTYQTRVKLFCMEEHGAWKERGVGQLRLNKRRSDGRGARMVIRAEGVLRVILNANMYVGMTCLEDGKHVRTTVFEDGKTLFVTLRTSNPKVAAELASAIQDHIPLESARATASPSAADSAV